MRNQFNQMDQMRSISESIAKHQQYIQDKAERVFYFGYNGGTFISTPELAAFVDLYAKRRNEIIVVDHNHVPIKIDNLTEFLDEILNVYAKGTNELYEHYESIRKLTNIEAAYDNQQQ